MTRTGAEGSIDAGAITLLVAVATIGGFMFGYDSGVINGTQDGLEAAFRLGRLGAGFTVGAILIGCAIGAFVAGRLSDVIGRRRVMMLAAALFLVSAIAAGAAASAAMFVLARICGGFGVGAASVISPLYISEIVPARVRGRLSSAQQVMIIAGLTGAFLVNYAVARLAGGSTATFWLGLPAWRWMFWAQIVPAAIYLAALLLIPESPRWLVLKGRAAEAQSVLARIYGLTAARAAVAEMRASLALATTRPRFADLIDQTTGNLRRIVWVGVGLAVFQQLVGINIVFYYGAVLWQSVGFSESDSLKINIVVGLVSICACLAAIALIDRWGRRPLLLAGSAAMAVALATMAFCFSHAAFGAQGAMVLPGSLGSLALGGAMLFVAAFNFSWGPVMWVMLGEMFPTRIRGSSLAVAGFAQWAANFGTSLMFPSMASALGLPLTYAVYVAGAVLSFGFVLAVVPETRGRELEAMQG